MISAAEVEAELNQPGRSKRTHDQNILLLALSLVAFYAAGLISATWISVTVLVAVLLIHEAGHWVGMKYFGYSDLRVFFIPFFGAAVSGNETKVSGERRAVVSLLGPVPGVFIGIGCGFIYLKWRQPVLLQFAITSVLLNGFNLLPIYPLDGGQFMQAVVFSRHPFVETVFKVVAVLILTGLALQLSSIQLGILAFVTLLLTREGYFQGRITRRLRDIMNGRQIPETEHMPVEYIEAILPDLGAGVPEKKVKVKFLANRTRSVWRRIAQPIPSFRSSVVLLAVYVGIFILGIAGSIVFLGVNKALSEKAVITHEITFEGQSVAVEEIYRNQHKISRAHLNDHGLYDGFSTAWTMKGIKLEDGSWHNGYRDGPWHYYNADGMVAYIVTF